MPTKQKIYAHPLDSLKYTNDIFQARYATMKLLGKTMKVRHVFEKISLAASADAQVVHLYWGAYAAHL